MFYPCFSLRPRVFHWNSPFSIRPRIFHQKACFSNSLFSTLRDSVFRESGPAFSTYPYSFVCCSTNRLMHLCQYAWKTVLFEVTRSFQRLAKVHDETKRKLSYFLPISSYWKSSRNETRNTEVLPWMAWSEIQVESLITPLQDVITDGKLECNHQTSRIQIWPIRNKQTTVFQKTPQTMDADLMEICGIEQIILCSRFRKCAGV